jgi:formate hydrogenlyase transcriptional activator
MGRTLDPLSEDCLRRLEAYSWPGNVRELQNIIERAVITSRDGRLNLDRALPESVNAIAAALTTGKNVNHCVRTVKELEELERQNIIAALDSADWKIAGANGAAQLLGMKPTTLSSRMKAFGIERH